MNKVWCTLDPHRLGDKLELSQGNLVVSTTEVCDYQRGAFGTIALGVGNASFECYFWSTSRPAGGLIDLCAVGLVEVGSALDQVIGDELEATTAALPMSWALRTNTTDTGGHYAAIVAGGIELDRLLAQDERVCIGVFFFGDISAPKVAFHINGNWLAQADLTPGRFYLPAVSIGSSASPTDVNAYLNFGQRGLDHPDMQIDFGSDGFETFHTAGWYEIISEGQVTLYFSATDEGMVTGPSDTPANKQFKPRVKNPETFSIRREPQVWVWGPTSVQGAAFAQLVLDNYDGAYNALLASDFRDSIVTIKLVQESMALLTGTTMADALTVCTAIIDGVKANGDEITITIKDTIARLDKQLPVRYNPPFVDDGAANNPIPLTFGACRNVSPLVIDTPNRIFQLHDSNIPNVTLVADKAAPLDPHAAPPQYVPALNGSGIQLETMPDGKLTVDCSSYGTQSVIPGADDVLGGDGEMNGAWAGSPAVPPGFAWSNGVGSNITEAVDYFGAGKSAAVITTASVWAPGASYGDYLSYPGVLLGGYSYRLNLSVNQIQSAPSIDQTMKGGLILATALSANAKDYIAGYRSPIQGVFVHTVQTRQNLSFEFTVPPGATRDLFIIITTSTGNTPGLPNGTAHAIVGNITLEQLGKYQELPLAGIPGDDLYTEILVKRAGEDSTIFDADEAAALTDDGDGGVIPMGIHYDAPPKVLDPIKDFADSRRCAIFTDNLGTLRTRQLKDPTDPAYAGSVIAHFSGIEAKVNLSLGSNMERPAVVWTDEAKGLTTTFGARRNSTVFGSSDFVTDQAIVTQNIKTRFSRTSQFQRTASQFPAGQYSFAVSAPIFDTLHDDPDDVQDMADETVGIYSPKVYADGSSTNGKRRFVEFSARFDDPTKIGIGTQCSIVDLMFGEFITFTYPNSDGSAYFVDQQAEVVAWEIFPFGRKVTLTVMV